VAADDPRLRRAALYGLGVICEHGGKLLTRSAATDLRKTLLGVLTDPTARYSANVEASEAAAASLGKLLVHRPYAVDDASAVLPVWLSWLPLRYSDRDASVAVASLCKLLEADAASVLGSVSGIHAHARKPHRACTHAASPAQPCAADSQFFRGSFLAWWFRLHLHWPVPSPHMRAQDGARFPMVLGAITAAYEAEATGADVNARLKSLVNAWRVSNEQALSATAAALPAAQQEKLGRLMA
jgi:hypothetical protein